MCKDNDDPGAPPAVEDQVKTEDKSPEDKSDTDIMVDMVTLRQKAKQNVIARAVSYTHLTLPTNREV